MSEDFKNAPFDRAEQNEETSAAVPGALQLDAAAYMADLEDWDMSEARKIEMLETLWSIMRAFVELGFKADICGHIFGESTLEKLQTADDVQLPHCSTTMKEAGDGNKKVGR